MKSILQKPHSRHRCPAISRAKAIRTIYRLDEYGQEAWEELDPREKKKNGTSQKFSLQVGDSLKADYLRRVMTNGYYSVPLHPAREHAPTIGSHDSQRRFIDSPTRMPQQASTSIMPIGLEDAEAEHAIVEAPAEPDVVVFHFLGVVSKNTRFIATVSDRENSRNMALPAFINELQAHWLAS